MLYVLLAVLVLLVIYLLRQNQKLHEGLEDWNEFWENHATYEHELTQEMPLEPPQKSAKAHLEVG